MIGLHHVKARIERLRELANGFSIEGDLWEGGSDLLTPAEAAAYTDSIDAAMDAADRAREAPEKALKRMEAGGALDPPPR